MSRLTVVGVVFTCCVGVTRIRNDARIPLLLGAIPYGAVDYSQTTEGMPMKKKTSQYKRSSSMAATRGRSSSGVVKGKVRSHISMAAAVAAVAVVAVSYSQASQASVEAALLDRQDYSPDGGEDFEPDARHQGPAGAKRGNGEELSNCVWTTEEDTRSGGTVLKVNCSGGRQIVAGGCESDTSGRITRSGPFENSSSTNVPDTNDYVDTVASTSGWACKYDVTATITVSALCCKQT